MAEATGARIRNVLFLCTGNSARSIMAEAILNDLGHGRFRAFSAGSHPTGKVNPLAVELLAATGLATADLRSKGWDEFGRPGAPPMDLVITVCDNAAGEVCPIWPGHPIAAHWGFEDPAAADGSDAAKRAKFRKVFDQIRDSVQRLVDIPLDALERHAAAARVKAIARDRR